MNNFSIEDFKRNHLVHSYVRSHETDKKDKWVWKCNNPLCTHTVMVPKKNRSILIGTMSLCPQCEKVQFVLTPRHLDRKKPICGVCKNPHMTSAARNLMDEALKGMVEKI